LIPCQLGGGGEGDGTDGEQEGGGEGFTHGGLDAAGDGKFSGLGSPPTQVARPSTTPETSLASSRILFVFS